MINFQALNVLLDTLRKPDPRPAPVASVVALRPALRVAGDGAPSVREESPPPDRGSPANAGMARTATPFPVDAPSTAASRLARALAGARGAAEVLLSSGGIELERALRGTGSRSPEAPIVRGGSPLVTASPPPMRADVDDRVEVARVAQALGAALEGAVQKSGLFYESHLARWIAGTYPQSALEAEPQSRDVTATPQPSGATGSSTDTARDLARLPAPLADTAASSVPAAAHADAGAPPLLRQQLDVLDMRQFAWIGEAWPGQRVAIRFEEAAEDDPHAPSPKPAGAAPVAAHIVLELPSLGAVGASVSLVGGAVRLQVTTDGPSATSRLHAARAALAEALAARAVPVSEIAVFDELG
jgi:hypothetical protein